MLVTCDFPSLCDIVIGKTYIYIYIYVRSAWTNQCCTYTIAEFEIGLCYQLPIKWTVHTFNYKLSAWCAAFHDLWKLDACVDTCNVDKCKVDKSNDYILSSRNRQHVYSLIPFLK